MPRLDRLWYVIDAETRGFDEGVLQSGAKLRSFVEYAKGNPIAVLGALGAAALATGVKLAQMAADYEALLVKVRTVTDTTQLSMEAIDAKITQLFRTLPIANIEELTEGIYEIQSSGIAGADALEFLEVSARAAVGGFTDVRTVVDGLTTTFNAFKAQGLGVAEIADLFAASVKAGKVEFRDLAANIGQVAPIAAQVGIPLEELLAVIVQLSLGGRSVSESTIAIRSALVNIIKPTDTLIKDYPILAKNFDLAALKAKGFADFLLELNEATGGNEKAINAVVPDVQGFVGVLGALQGGGEGTVKALAEMRKSYGLVRETQELVTATTKSQTQILNNEFAEALRDIGGKLLPQYNRGLAGTLGLMRLLNGEHEKRMTGERLKMNFGTLAGITDQNIRTADRDRSGLQRGGRFNDGSNLFATQVEDQYQKFRRTLKETLEDYKSGALDLSKTTADQAQTIFTAIQSGIRTGMIGAKEYQALISDLMLVAPWGVTDAAPAPAGTKAPPKKTVKFETPEERAGREEADKKEIARIKELGQAAVDAGDRILRARDAAAKVATDLTAQMEDEVVRATSTAVDDLTLALTRLIAEAQPLIAQGLMPQSALDTMVGLRQEAITVAKALERAAAIVDATDRADGSAGTTTDLQQLAVAEAGLRVQLAHTSSSAQQKLIQEAIEAIQRRRVGIQKELTDEAKKEAEAGEKRRRQLVDLARSIEASARGALQLAQAFNLVDDATARTLENIAQLGANMPGLLDAISKFNTIGADGNRGGSLLGIASAALPVVGAIASLVGSIGKKSPEDRAYEQHQKDNTAALKQLTQRVGDLARMNLTGSELTKYQRLLADPRLAFRNDGLTTDGTNRVAGSVFDDFGITAEEMREFAKQFGLTIGTTKGDRFSLTDFEQLRQAIKASELTEFADTFSGQLQKIDTEIRLFDITDPIQQFTLFRKALDGIKGGGGKLASTLAQFDLTTAEGVAKAREAIQTLFREMPSMVPDDLGGLTPQEFVDALLKSDEYLTSAGPEGTGGYNVSQTITEATGSHLAGLLFNVSVFTERTAIAAEAMARAMGASLIAPVITPPSLASMGGGGGFGAGAGISVGTLAVTVQMIAPGSSTAHPEAVGREIGELAAQATSEALARLVRRRRLANGETVVS